VYSDRSFASSKTLVMNKLVFILFLFVTALTTAQTGTVTGVLIDKDVATENEPVAFASVVLKGTTYGAQSDFDGKYRIVAPAGTYTLVVSFVGMKTVEVIDVVVKNGFTTNVDVEMTAESASLDAVSIVVAKSREGTDVLLEEKKNAVTIKQSIGAEELSQKGVSDAEGAVTKVSGVSKQSGVKNVFVRGLGDRYNSTTLNGLPLPSDDPEYKNIALDFFSSDLIETVDINKVFNSQITAEAAGANINIDLKGLTNRSEFNASVSTGANMQTLGKEFKNIDGEGFFGFSDAELPVSNLNSYGFDNKLNASNETALPNLGLSLNGGKRFDIGDNYVNIYGLLTFDNSYRFIDGKVRNTNNAGTIYLDQDYVSYDYQTSQIAQLDVDYRMGRNNIEFITMYIHKNSQELQEFQGIDTPEQTGDEVFFRRQQTKDNNLFVNQLLGNFELSNQWDLSLKGSFNAIRGSEPDRRDFQYLLRDGFYSPNIDSGGNNQRYFSKIQENDYNAIANLKYDFNKEDSGDLLNELNFGGDYRFTHHVFQAVTFNHNVNNRFEVDINDTDQFYNQGSLVSSRFNLVTGRGSASNPEAFNPFYYIGDKYVASGQASYTREFSDKLLVSVGGRYEDVLLEVIYDTNLSSSELNGPSRIEEGLFLPSASLKYALNDENILRAGYSKTYILPRFNEIAPFRINGTGGNASQGNPNLDLSKVANYDLAYEFYPNKGELISVTGFFKTIENPIARVEIPSGGNTLTFLNVSGDRGSAQAAAADKATVVGVEVELRKNLFEKELPTGTSDKIRSSKLDLGFNASYLSSNQKLTNTLAQFTNEESQLQGAAPLLFNLDFNYNTYINSNNLNTAVVFNYFTERVYSVGTRGFENIKEIGVPTLDLVSSLSIGENGKLSLKARNLLNPEYRFEREGSNQQNVVLEQYRRGVDLSLGYSYKF
jgi:outer membrane receptor protein involved in Fe transport